MEFKPTGMGNETIEHNGVFVSYNPDTTQGLGGAITALGSFLMLGMGVEMNTSHDETALFGPDEKWRILRGDFRKEYLGLIEQGFEACVAFFNEQEDARSDWSSDDMEEAEG